MLVNLLVVWSSCGVKRGRHGRVQIIGNDLVTSRVLGMSFQIEEVHSIKLFTVYFLC